MRILSLKLKLSNLPKVPQLFVEKPSLPASNALVSNPDSITYYLFDPGQCI